MIVTNFKQLKLTVACFSKSEIAALEESLLKRKYSAFSLQAGSDKMVEKWLVSPTQSL